MGLILEPNYEFKQGFLVQANGFQKNLAHPALVWRNKDQLILWNKTWFYVWIWSFIVLNEWKQFSRDKIGSLYYDWEPVWWCFRFSWSQTGSSVTVFPLLVFVSVIVLVFSFLKLLSELPIIEGNWWVICAVEFNWRGRFSADSRLEKNSIDASWLCSTFAIFSMTVESLLNYCKFSDTNFIGMNDCCLVS